MSEGNPFKLTPREITAKIEKCIRANNVPFVKGSPGVGKSAVFKAAAKQHRLLMVDIRLSTCAPEDLQGLPTFVTVNGVTKAIFAPYDLFPLLGDVVPEGYDGWYLFFDEINSASKALQAAAYRVLLDREVGGKPLHPNVYMGCAGNLDTDKAITTIMGTAMRSRLCTFHMVVNFQEWLEDVAYKENYDSRVIAYLMRYPTKLHEFMPDSQDDSFCCPRTWEFTNRFVKLEPEGPISDDEVSTYAGTISAGVAADFVGFTKVFGTLLNIQTVLDDPEGAPIAKEPNQAWGNIVHFMDHTTTENLSKMCVYAGRLPLDMKIMYFRGLLLRHPEWIQNTDFMKATIDMTAKLKV